MSEHTPGPWVLDGIAIAHMSEPNGYPVDICLMGEPLQVGGDVKPMLTNYEANARLIAAAPDLLEALEFMYENGDGYDAREKARDAIAKARGAK